MPGETTLSLPAKILHVAWMSILLGIGIEIALLLAAAAFGRANPVSPFVADLAGKISWSMLVCVGISIGSAAASARGPVMGLLGLISAPAGFAVAKAAHKSAAQALDTAIAVAASGPSPTQFLILRAAEYALLGLVVGHISQRPWGKLSAYAAAGLVTGLGAAAVVLGLTVSGASTATPTLALVSKGINEILFPLGCSIVLYVVNTLGQRTRIAVAT